MKKQFLWVALAIAVSTAMPLVTTQSAQSAIPPLSSQQLQERSTHSVIDKIASIQIKEVAVQYGIDHEHTPAQANSPRSFLEWCKRWQQHDLNVDSQITISALMNRLDSADCQSAQARFQKITALYAIETAPTPLGEHEFAINLRTLVDLAPLVAAMPHLRHLEIPNAFPLEIASLSRLQQLESLTLPEANLEDISPLADLRNLVRLDLRGNAIRDLSPIIRLQRLEYLDVSNNQIQDFSVLSELPNLFRISIRGNPIDSSTCLGKWTEACEPDDMRK